MKVSIEELLDRADAKKMAELLDGINCDARTPKSTRDRIRARLVSKNHERRPAANVSKRMIQAVCVLMILAAGAIIFVGIFSKNNALPYGHNTSSDVRSGAISSPDDISAPMDDSSGSDFPAPAHEVIQLFPVYEQNDRFAEEPKTVILSSSGATGDRVSYNGFEFYESCGTLYMTEGEGSPIYKYENEGFVDTGIIAPERMLFSEGTYEGSVYISAPDVLGLNGKNIYRFDLNTGLTEEFINVEIGTVDCIAIDGSKLYYVNCGRIKCADLETSEISVIDNAVHTDICRLTVSDGDLYYYSEGKIWRLTPEMQLHEVVEGTESFSSSGGKIYCASFQDVKDDESGTVTREFTLNSYDTDGNGLWSLRSAASSPRESGERFTGNALFSVPVSFGGKAVSFNSDGVFLTDTSDGNKEKIIDFSEYKHILSVRGIQNVGGKLFAAVYGQSEHGVIHHIVFEYDGKSIKKHELR